MNGETGEWMTAGDMLSLSLQIAEGLKSIGLKEEDVVALLGVNTFKAQAAALGILWLGGTVALLDPSLKCCK